LSLPFTESVFDFAFDLGCFHHAEATDRPTYIEGVYRVLKLGSTYLLACFSYRNGPSWNHFRKEQIVRLFSDLFEIESIRHISSIEADRVTRYFYEVLMRKAGNSR